MNVVWPGIKQIHLIYQHIEILVRFTHNLHLFFTYSFFIFTYTVVRSYIKQILQLINTLRLEACRAGFNTQFTATLCALKHRVRFLYYRRLSRKNFSFVLVLRLLIFIQFVVIDVYDETAKVLIVTFYVRNGDILLLRYFYCTALTYLKNT